MRFLKETHAAKRRRSRGTSSGVSKISAQQQEKTSARILLNIFSPLRAPRGHTSAAPPKRIDNERKVNRMSALRRLPGLRTRNEVVGEILSLEGQARIEKQNRAAAGRPSGVPGRAAAPLPSAGRYGEALRAAVEPGCRNKSARQRGCWALREWILNLKLDEI